MAKSMGTCHLQFTSESSNHFHRGFRSHEASNPALCTPQEFNIEKLQLLEAEKGKIRKDFERRESQIDVKKKIEFSKQLNASRIKARS